MGMTGGAEDWPTMAADGGYSATFNRKHVSAEVTLVVGKVLTIGARHPSAPQTRVKRSTRSKKRKTA